MAEDRMIDNFTMRTWLEVMENILGENGLKSILNYAKLQEYIDEYPPDNHQCEIPLRDARTLFLALREMFGEKGARSLQIRVGREAVRIGREKYSAAITKAMKVGTRLIPEGKRIQLILNKFLEDRNERYPSQFETPAKIKEEKESIVIVDHDWLESEQLTSDTPVCGVNVGMIQALLEWITGNKYEVEEVECRAMGDSADVFKISKKRR